MKTNFKRILSIIMCAVMLFTALPTASFAADRAVIDSGTCGAQGDNLTWTLYDDGELVIGGEGEMDWYDVDSEHYPKLPPWYGHYDKIDVITVMEGVTSIGHHAFFTGLKENGKAPAKYYKITLPRSLVFAEGKIFDILSRNRIPGQHLAFCYAGSESDWTNVEFKNCSIRYEDDKPAELTYIGGTFGNRIVSSDFEKLYFNGEEPENFCELQRYYSDDIDIVTHYYAPDAEKIVWYAVHGDEVAKVGEIPTGEYVTAEIRLPAIKEGDLYVKAELVDADGNVIVASENFLIQSIPVDDRTFGEKVEDFFTLGFANTVWTLYWTAYIVLGYISSVVNIPYYIYQLIANAIKREQ